MALHLSHYSAVRYWLTKSGDECVPDIESVSTLAEATANASDLKEARLPFGFDGRRPLHVLVSDKATKRNREDVACHVWSGPVLPGSFYGLYGASRVSSPEFTFLQMASCLSLRELVELGDYLCGAFSVDDEKQRFSGLREPLTSVERIESFLNRSSGAYGACKASHALRYVVDRAASPMEVKLAMMFSLPAKEGGWNMPVLQLNEKIPVSKEYRALAGSQFYFGDIYFPTVNGDIEYDSYEFHTGRHRLDHTQKRRNILEVMGVKTMSATWDQIATFESFSTFVLAVKKRFGIRVKPCSPDVGRAREGLYEFLMRPSRRMF